MTELHEHLQGAFRAHSLEANFFLQAVAERLGVGATDFACLTILLLEGPATAGRLAERTGLTTGAITGVIDRLAGQGRVRRAVDPADRRRVVVEPVYERAGEIHALFQPMLADAQRMQGMFTAEQLETVRRYIVQATQMLVRHTERLRSGTAPGAAEDRVTDAELHLSGVGTRTSVRVGDTGGELWRLDGAGPPPSVRTAGNRVMLKVRGRARAGRGDIVLSPAVRWAVEVSGGSSRLEIDLRGGRLSGMSLRGGASHLDVTLPDPRGVVPVRVAGGASRVAVRRPRGVPVAVTLRGGASQVTVDGVKLPPVAGEGRVGDLPAGTDGFEIEVSGGANRLVVEES